MARGPTNPPPGDDRITVVCLHCGRPQDVARRAVSITCRYCAKSLKLEDLRFTGYESRRAIETCGIVTVEKKAQVVSDRITCGGLVVRGKVKAAITARGPVLIGPEATVQGNVTAPTVAIGAGAVLEGDYRVGQPAQTALTPADAPPPEPPPDFDDML